MTEIWHVFSLHQIHQMPSVNGRCRNNVIDSPSKDKQLINLPKRYPPLIALYIRRSIFNSEHCREPWDYQHGTNNKPRRNHGSTGKIRRQQTIPVKVFPYVDEYGQRCANWKPPRFVWFRLSTVSLWLEILSRKDRYKKKYKIWFRFPTQTNNTLRWKHLNSIIYW